MQLADQGVLITGAASGIGAALAQRFSDEGARLVLADIDGDAVGSIAGDLGARALTVDVARPDANARMIDDAEAALGAVDLVCLNAGIVIEGGVEAGDGEWQTMWDVNVMAHVWALRALLPRMLERGEGYILHTASAAGLLTQLGSAPYAVTKHAVVALAEWLAVTYRHQGIKVSILAPQAVNTPMVSTFGNEQSVARVAAIDGILEPEEVAQAVVEGLAEERFLILPHPQVQTYFQRKAGDYDRWIGGLNKLQQSLAAENAPTGS